jgi:hypothetical protein
MEVTMPVNKQKEMEEMGWADSIDNIPARFQNSYYIKGYKQGETDKE